MDEDGVYLSSASLKSLNKCKRRRLDPASWKCRANKVKKDKGLGYTIIRGNKAGTVVEPIRPPSGEKICRCIKSGCNLPAPFYKELFKSFRNVTADKQNQILAECVEISEPKHRYVEKENAMKKKEHTYSYSLKFKGKRHAICRRVLLETFKVTNHRMRTILSKMEDGKITFEDGRGKTLGVNPKIISDDYKDKIRQHISSFQTYESHYCRGSADADRRYLDADLNVTKMLSLFNEIQLEMGNRLCKYDAYNHIFKTEFDLRFGLPRKDTCNYCDGQLALIERTTCQAQKTVLQEAYDTHKEVAAAARKMHKEDGSINDQHTFSITADMQKVLFVPHLTCSSFYFKRKLSTFNLGIHETGKESADMFMWDETIAEHTSKDVLSCVYKYITEKFQQLQPAETRNFIIWTDRFVGQFNNCYFVLFMKYLVDIRLFTRVEHKFFVTGHSWMVCDRDFGLIEKRYRQVSPIVPSDIEEVISSARINNPFQIHKMQRADFFDFSILPNYVALPPKLMVTRYHWFRYEASSPNIVQVKSNHNTATWTNFQLNLKKKTGFKSLKKFPPSYKGPLKINESKAKDLRDLMGKIPDMDKHAYFDELTKFVLK